MGGPDGEMGASMRYLSQRFTAPNRITMGVLTDVGISVTKLRITDQWKQYITSHHNEMFPTETFSLFTFIKTSVPQDARSGGSHGAAGRPGKRPAF